MNVVRKNPVILSFILIIFSYFTLSVITPVKSSVAENYEISESTLRLINTSILIPVIVIYLISLFGYIAIKNYASSIEDHDDGRGFMLISRGMAWLAFALPMRSLVSAAFDYISQNKTGFEDERTIIANFVTVAFSLLAFMYLSDGADLLNKTVKNAKRKSQQHIWIVGTIVVSSLFTLFVVNRPAGEERVYYLSDFAVLFLVIIPYLYAWYRGIHAAYNIRRYRYAVRGALYREGLIYLSYGIVGAVISSVAIQVVIAVSSRLNRLNIQPVLLIVYLLLLLLGVSFFLINKGAKKLHKIEDV